jgi:8-oxo-dGTP pyrophosphatase MutT (NUDIX family)
MTKAVLGIIGGSGIYDLPGLTNAQTKAIGSPWGKPSAALLTGEIAGLPIVFLSRHDKGHRISPTDINYRANIDGLKRAGVTDLVSLSACGSFKEDGIFYPGPWGLFGGAMEPGEAADAALRRELQEELGLAAPEMQHMTDFSFTFGRLGTVTRHFFQVVLPASALAGLRLAEGTDMRSFLPSEILNLPRVVPYDSFAIWLHASGLLRQ